MAKYLSEQLDLNLLGVFLEVYRLNSITLASESLDMTQPGVSGSLKRLQDQIGTKLFVREGRGISPTHAAVQLADQLEPALQNVSRAIGSIKQFTPDQPRQFNVLVNEMALLALQPLVEADKDLANVSIIFNMVSSNEEMMLQALSLQKADLAIDVFRPHDSGFKSTPIKTDELVLVARHSHPRVKGSITMEQFYAEKHITLRLRRGNLYAVDYFTSESLEKRNISAECDSLITMMALVSNSDSIGSASRTVATQYAELFGLQIIEQPFKVTPIEQHMIWHNRTQTNPSHVWLREKITQYLKGA
ncbi:conserved hypothetical protein [Vibrio nigripulchritudo MADA3029]|uniref:LysR family transcriptional regulator n=1 Tax=Vibrio nigripulchritudo TaxID=28173 RepID=UPI0003B1ABE7|nr:LysR family transcriptional regulator [Vibrio nigripulchritudo]CCN50038.1 conserved hypothetical protein [Vibrio nigripulchritudo MADA3020]CCN56124.1 conserved hypothetical protein [Vibrio nigripulchritudo MADA3021]CCN59043.1 conserved hypothetical protein [Vibrio nigripulchritudo MADA3029]